jgi:hypothetical protein
LDRRRKLEICGGDLAPAAVPVPSGTLQGFSEIMGDKRGGGIISYFLDNGSERA